MSHRCWFSYSVFFSTPTPNASQMNYYWICVLLKRKIIIDLTCTPALETHPKINHLCPTDDAEHTTFVEMMIIVCIHFGCVMAKMYRCLFFISYYFTVSQSGFKSTFNDVTTLHKHTLYWHDSLDAHSARRKNARKRRQHEYKWKMTGGKQWIFQLVNMNMKDWSERTPIEAENEKEE